LIKASRLQRKKFSCQQKTSTKANRRQRNFSCQRTQSEPSATEEVFLPTENIDQSEPSATQFFLPEDIDQSEPSATEEVFLPTENIDQSEPSATQFFLPEDTKRAVCDGRSFPASRKHRPKRTVGKGPFHGKTELFDLMYCLTTFPVGNYLKSCVICTVFFK